MINIQYRGNWTSRKARSAISHIKIKMDDCIRLDNISEIKKRETK